MISADEGTKLLFSSFATISGALPGCPLTHQFHPFLEHVLNEAAITYARLERLLPDLDAGADFGPSSDTLTRTFHAAPDADRCAVSPRAILHGVRSAPVSVRPLADDEMATVPQSRVVFLHWDWSGQSALGLQRLGAVDGASAFEVIRPDEDHEFAKWLTQESERLGLPLHGGGYGSLLRVVDDHVVSFMPSVHDEPMGSLRAWFSGQPVG